MRRVGRRRAARACLPRAPPRRRRGACWRRAHRRTDAGVAWLRCAHVLERVQEGALRVREAHRTARRAHGHLQIRLLVLVLLLAAGYVALQQRCRQLIDRREVGCSCGRLAHGQHLRRLRRVLERDVERVRNPATRLPRRVELALVGRKVPADHRHVGLRRCRADGLEVAHVQLVFQHFLVFFRQVDGLLAPF